MGDHESAADAEQREAEAASGADTGIAPIKPARGGGDPNDRLRRAHLIRSWRGAEGGRELSVAEGGNAGDALMLLLV